MPKKLTQEEVVTYFRKKKLNPIEEYKGVRIPLKCMCLVCNKTVTPTLESLKAGRGGCVYCAGSKVDPEDAVRLFKQRGLIPQIPYPGSKVPWKSIHKKCNRIVFPTYNKIQVGQSGCVDCSGLKKKSQEETIEFFKSKGLIPQEPYVNSHSKWKSIHKKCGNIVYPRFSDVSRGGSGCIHCVKISEKDAVKLFKKAGLNPLTHYPGSLAPWSSIHEKCGQIVSPTYSSIQQGNGPCDYCGGSMPINAAKAVKYFELNGFKPLEDFRNAKSPWKSRHINCGEIVFSSYSRIKNGGGCRACLEKTWVTPEDAELIMRARNIIPITNFPGSGKPWRSIHSDCGKEISPVFNSIKYGGGCKYCVVKGFKLALPALVYLATNSELNSHKIGIAGLMTKRLQDHKKNGWTIHKTMDFAIGEDALNVEQSVLIWLRTERELPVYLLPEQMPQGGNTETIDASEIDLETIWAEVVKKSRVKK